MNFAESRVVSEKLRQGKLELFRRSGCLSRHTRDGVPRPSAPPRDIRCRRGVDIPDIGQILADILVELLTRFLGRRAGR